MEKTGKTDDSVIYLMIGTEKELYNPFDLEKNLSEDVKTYINQKASAMVHKDALRICIVSQEPVCEEDVRAAFARWGLSSQEELKRTAKKNLIKMIWLFLFGALVIALALFLQSRINTLLYTIITTVGTFSIWEGASVWIIKGPDLRNQKKLLNRIIQITAIEFTTAE